MSYHKFKIPSPEDYSTDEDYQQSTASWETAEDLWIDDVQEKHFEEKYG